MKFSDAAGTKGSFGIPQELKDAHERQRAKTQSKPASQAEAPQAEAPQEAEVLDEAAGEMTPEKVLEKMGAKFTEEDFQRLIFKGNYETDIDVIPGRLKAKFRTLTSQEYDEIDEIIANEIKDVAMTNDGLRTRTAMWIIAYGVTELAGKPLAKPTKDKDGKVDSKAIAASRREIFAAMAPAVVNLLIQKHGAITMAVNSIAADPSGNLKNS
jgi:hypothetical protein